MHGWVKWNVQLQLYHICTTTLSYTQIFLSKILWAAACRYNTFFQTTSDLWYDFRYRSVIFCHKGDAGGGVGRDAKGMAPSKSKGHHNAIVIVRAKMSEQARFRSRLSGMEGSRGCIKYSLQNEIAKIDPFALKPRINKALSEQARFRITLGGHWQKLQMKLQQVGGI